MTFVFSTTTMMTMVSMMLLTVPNVLVVALEKVDKIDVLFVTLNGTKLGLIDPNDAANTRIVGEFENSEVYGIEWRPNERNFFVSVDPRVR